MNSGAQNLNYSNNGISKSAIAQGSCGFAPQDMIHHRGNGMASGHLVDLGGDSQNPEMNKVHPHGELFRQNEGMYTEKFGRKQNSNINGDMGVGLRNSLTSMASIPCK